MRILCLWVVNYHSGSTSERFIKPLESLGHQVTVIPLEEGIVEARIIQEVKTGNYDLLLHLPYPDTLRLEIIKHLPITTVAWCGDDEWFWNLYPKLAQNIAFSHDYCITTFEPALKHYSSGILASWGHTEDWSPKKVKKNIDIYFCGSRTPYRDAYIKDLIDAGFKVVFEGSGYQGKLDLHTMIDRYRHAKIGLSFVSEEKEGFMYKQVKARSFEIPALRTFQLSEDCPELHDYFNPGKELDVFQDSKSLIEKCKYYLSNEKKREAIAMAGYLKSLDYSYANIFKRAFSQITLKENHVKA